jgi:hypothetical protein
VAGVVEPDNAGRKKMGKIGVGLGAAGVVVVVMEWLMVSHTVSWLVSGVLPH